MCFYIKQNMAIDQDVLKVLYMVIKKSLCTWMITIQKVTSHVQTVPCQSPDIY
jgi:hypothetical protein